MIHCSLLSKTRELTAEEVSSVMKIRREHATRSQDTSLTKADRKHHLRYLKAFDFLLSSHIGKPGRIFHSIPSELMTYFNHVDLMIFHI